MPLHSSLATEQDSVSKKKKGLAWLLMPVIPATQEAEAGESLEPGRQKSQGAEITPLHSSLDDKARLRRLKNKTKQKLFSNLIHSI